MHPLERKITDKILKDLVSKDDQCIVLAVSGGPDSMALLHLMYPLQTEKGFTLVVVYVNHGLRPDETGEEEQLVHTQCNDLGIVFEVLSVDVPAYADSSKKSLEHAARDLRYEALHSIKEKHKATLIAVAHTADDQAEEVLLRVIRGSGLKGLAGMAERSGEIIRPLLSEEKETLLGYLQEKHIPYCLDSSNTDMRFLRNRIRQQLIPFLEQEFDVGIRNALRKTADSLTEDEIYLDYLADKAFHEVILSGDFKGKLKKLTLDRHALAGLPVSLQRRVTEKILWKAGCMAKYDYIIKIVEAARFGTPGTELHLSRGLRVGILRDQLDFLYPEGKVPWRGKLYV